MIDIRVLFRHNTVYTTLERWVSTSSFALFRADILLVVHTPSSREYELVTNMSNEVDLNDEIMEHSFTLIFEMSCVYNLPKKIEITFHISNAIASLIIWIQGIWNYNKSWNDFIVLCCKLMWFQFSTYIQKIYIHDAATFFFLERCPAYLPNMLLKNSQREKHLFKQFSWTI